MTNAIDAVTDFPIFTGQSSINVLYRFNNIPNPPGSICGSTDDNDYLLIFYAIPSFSLILYQRNNLISVTPINSIVPDVLVSVNTIIHYCIF